MEGQGVVMAKQGQQQEGSSLFATEKPLSPWTLYLRRCKYIVVWTEIPSRERKREPVGCLGETFRQIPPHTTDKCRTSLLGPLGYRICDLPSIQQAQLCQGNRAEGSGSAVCHPDWGSRSLGHVE